MNLLTVLLGILGGAAVGVQTPFANSIGQRVGATASSLIVHVTGSVFSLLLLLLSPGDKLHHWRSLPWWSYLVGVFGLILYLTINFTIPRIGVTGAVALLILGQLAAGMLIDHFGLLGVGIRPVDLPRLIGVGLLMAGSLLIIR